MFQTHSFLFLRFFNTFFHLFKLGELNFVLAGKVVHVVVSTIPNATVQVVQHCERVKPLGLKLK